MSINEMTPIVALSQPFYNPEAGTFEARAQLREGGALFSYSGVADHAVIATKDAVLFATQPPSLGNLRLVFG